MANPKSSDQLVLSYELLQLLEWLMEHEADSLKRIIKRALSKGLDKELKHRTENYQSHELQGNIIDFLELLEILLVEAGHEASVDSVVRKNLLPAIDHIDTSNFSSGLLESSATIATTKKEKNPQENAQELLFKELLKRWKPKKKLSH